MFNQEQIDYLLALPKEALNPEAVLNLAENKIRIDLISPEDDEWKFILDINRSKKSQFRISLHHQENNTKVGLLRIDFNSGHINPEIVNEFVPEFLHKYANQHIEVPHIHFQVPSYKDLAWAMPLSEYDAFNVKDVQNMSDYSDAIYAFADKVNIISKFVIQTSII